MSYRVPDFRIRPSASSVEPKGKEARIISTIRHKVSELTNIQREISAARQSRFESAKSRVLDIVHSDVFDSIRDDLLFDLKFTETKFEHLGLRHLGRAGQLDDAHIQDLKFRQDLIISSFTNERNSAFLKDVANALYTTIVFYELTIYEGKTEIKTLNSPWCRSFTPYGRLTDAQNRIADLEKNIERYDSILDFLRKFYLAVVSSDALDLDLDLDVLRSERSERSEQTNRPAQPINFVL